MLGHFLELPTYFCHASWFCMLFQTLNYIATMSQVVGPLEGHLSLEGHMWSGPKGSTRQLLFGCMALVIMDQGNFLYAVRLVYNVFFLTFFFIIFCSDVIFFIALRTSQPCINLILLYFYFSYLK